MAFFRGNSEYLKKLSSKKLKRVLIGRTPYQKILRIYGLIILIGAALLVFPFSHQSSSSGFNFFDSCFTAISAFTNTGLTTHTTSTTFNFFGQLIILLLIQIGGMGFMTLLVFLWIFIKKSNYNTEQRWFLHFERGSSSRVETLPVVKSGILFLLITELIGAVLLSIFFFFSTPLTAAGNGDSITFKGNMGQSIWAGVFHSISAANNAGFDIIGSKSIVPFRNEANNFLSVVLMIESIIGGIGYPVFHDVFCWIKNKRKRRPTRFSLFSKVAISSYIFVAFFSILLAIFFEAGMGWRYDKSLLFKDGQTNSNGYGWGDWSIANKVWNIIYITFSTRSSGFASLDPKELTDASRWFLAMLMFIGTSPASTGGGIRTITVYIIVHKMFQMASGRKHLTVYKKTIDQKVVYESWNVFVLSTILIIFSSFFIMLSLPPKSELTVVDVIFEATSAFGTVGLSSGVTENANFVGRIVLMLLMFIGQMGISNALVSVTDLNPKDNLQYCSESLRIA